MPEPLMTRPNPAVNPRRRVATQSPSRGASAILFCWLFLAAAFGCSSRSESGPGRSGAAADLIPTDSAGVLKAARGAGAQAAMVNVWATFCQPCREEFPAMMRLYDNYRGKGFRLVLVSADFPAQADRARAFLTSQGVTFDTYIKREKDAAFIDGMDARWSGAIPATWVIDGEGNVVDFWEGKASYEQFERALLKVLRSDANG
jgi:thiol-disulfide isomerase/thioredoxin